MDQATDLNLIDSPKRNPLSAAMVRLVIGLVRLYRITLGPVLGGQCIYQPTCSQYMIDAVRKHGPIRGAWRGAKRIARCHPWGRGGHDPA